MEGLKNKQKRRSYYYTLQFKYRFEHSQDRVYFAYTRPHSITRVAAFLRCIREDLEKDAEKITVLDPHKEAEQEREPAEGAESKEAKDSRDGKASREG